MRLPRRTSGPPRNDMMFPPAKFQRPIRVPKKKTDKLKNRRHRCGSGLRGGGGMRLPRRTSGPPRNDVLSLRSSQ